MVKLNAWRCCTDTYKGIFLCCISFNIYWLKSVVVCCVFVVCSCLTVTPNRIFAFTFSHFQLLLIQFGDGFL